MKSAKPAKWNPWRQSPFLIRLFNWEYWPIPIAYTPVYFYWFYLSVKARSPFFISASNPVIDTGGLYGESKMITLDLVPEIWKPKTLLIKKGTSFNEVLQLLTRKEFYFPMVAKPEVGERGFQVTIVENENELKKYFHQKNINIIVQEFVEYHHEYNVLYYRMPDEERGTVSSITIKEFLTVTGNGSSTVEDLILENPRAVLQLERFRKSYNGLLQSVPGKDEKVKLEPIGNHCRGTKFVNGNHLINEEVITTIDRIAKHLKDCFILRFDVKCKSPEDLKTGINLKIVEVNGSGGEPTHIYDPDYPLFDSYRDLLKQWDVIYKVSQINRKKGVPYMTFSEALKKFKDYKRAVS